MRLLHTGPDLFRGCGPGGNQAGIPSHVSADLLSPPEFTNAELRERMSGNLCRCGAYSNIAEAIAEVAGAAGSHA